MQTKKFSQQKISNNNYELRYIYNHVTKDSIFK